MNSVMVTELKSSYLWYFYEQKALNSVIFTKLIMVEVEALDKETIIKINEGIPYKMDEGLMQSGDANLDFVIYRTSRTRGINRKASVLMKGIIQSHPFRDGNKRTGFIAAKTLLELNGKKFDKIHELTKVEFTLNIATKEINISKMAEWFSNHIRGK